MILFNNLFNLTKEEIGNSKIELNIHDNRGNYINFQLKEKDENKINEKFNDILYCRIVLNGKQKNFLIQTKKYFLLNYTIIVI